MESNKIKDYRQIHYWENFFLDSAVYSIGQAVGFDYEEGFQIISAITGDLFTYMYSEEDYCDSGFTNSFFVPEKVKEAYALFGYSCTYLSHEEICAEPEMAVEQIRRSVDRGIPVLAWGCGGVKTCDGTQYDPLPEASLIGGYDENNLLYVNLYLPKERLAETSACQKPGVDEHGYTAIFADEALGTTMGIFILGEQIPRTDIQEIYRRAICLIPQFLTVEPADGYLFGRSAFEKWASVLLTDEYWKDAKTAETNCWDKHCAAYCALCTSIGVGNGEGIVRFMRKAAKALPDVKEAGEILPLFEKLRSLNQSIWDYQGGFMPPFDKLTEHGYREHLAEILCRMGAVCDEILSVFR